MSLHEEPGATPEAGGDPWGWVRVLRRFRRAAVLMALAAGLLVHVSYALIAAYTPTTYVVRFEVRYRSGTAVLAGLASLVGRDLPSLRLRSTIETQVEILQSREVRKRALRRLKAYAGLTEEQLATVSPPYRLSINAVPQTDIIAVEVRGHDGDGALEYAHALLAEYHAHELSTKRSKETALQAYIVEQIGVFEEKIGRLQEVLRAHQRAKPLEEARERAAKRETEANETLLTERRKRRHVRDAYLDRFTPAHPLVAEVERSIAAIDSIIAARTADELRPYLASSDAQLAALRADALEEARRRGELEAQVHRLRAEVGERYAALLRAGAEPDRVQREYSLAQETYEGLKRRLHQVELSIQDVSSDVETLSEPYRSVERPAPSWVISVVVALVAGLVGPFALESLAVSCHTVEELEHVSGLRALAVVPRVTARAAALLPRGDPALDAMRLLRTNLESRLDYPPRRLILVSGAEPQEGKSMIAANLAAVYADMGVPTLLVDLDLRRPSVHRNANVRRAPGLTEVISGARSWQRAVQTTAVEHLHVLSAGAAVEDSGGHLAAVRLAEILGELQEFFAVVICDSPALLAVPDASFVARLADAVVVVYALSVTPNRSLTRTLGMLSTAKANTVGVVANDVRGLSSSSSYGYYGPEHAEASRRPQGT